MSQQYEQGGSSAGHNPVIKKPESGVQRTQSRGSVARRGGPQGPGEGAGCWRRRREAGGPGGLSRRSLTRYCGCRSQPGKLVLFFSSEIPLQQSVNGEGSTPSRSGELRWERSLRHHSSPSPPSTPVNNASPDHLLFISVLITGSLLA